jgi:beta-xylosidase
MKTKITMLAALALGVACAADGDGLLATGEFRIRDPFVLPIAQEKTYYMYASGKAEGGYGCKTYMSKDLEHWSNPVTVFDPPAEYKDCNAYWAPEVHEYKGRFYLFMTLKAPRKYRGTHIFVADNPTGPFVPTSKRA